MPNLPYANGRWRIYELVHVSKYLLTHQYSGPQIHGPVFALGDFMIQLFARGYNLCL